MRFAAVRAWARRHPQLADAALGMGLLTLPVIAVLIGAGQGRSDDFGPVMNLLAAIAALTLITGRRRWPMQLLVLATAVSAAFVIATGDQHPAATATWLIVAFTFAGRTDRRRAWITGGACIVALYVVTGLFGDGGWLAQQSLGASAWAVAALALGDARRSRRAYIAEMEQRTRRAEESREEEARRRVAEERLRIARELHDVVAHHIAVINVQAGAAEHVRQTRPEAVGPALAHIRHASVTVMKELASVVGLLRSPEEPDPATEPTRGMARLVELLDTFAAAGLQVEHRQRGTARELPAVVDLAAYRIVQESLTNAQKYGTGKARLTVTYTLEEILIDVDNAIAVGGQGNGSGYGLIGMRERASAAGGTVSSGVGPDGRFAVHAELPGAPDVTS